MNRQTWYWWGEISWYATTFLGAEQNKSTDKVSWAKPLYEAFCSGLWILFWTDDTVYWIAKPSVHVEPANNPRGRRLHNEHYAAIESDLENLYFWHGVLVPAFVVVRPDWITVDHIKNEANAEVRRVMMERYGWDRYAADAGATMIHRDDWGTLWELSGGPRVVEVVNSTAEPDGNSKHYWLAVDRRRTTALDAIASTWRLRTDPNKRLTGAEYASMLVAQS